ncbi:hypothetical protein OROMI_024036 [Orobanche minor]
MGDRGRSQGDLSGRDRIVCGRSALRADLADRDRMFAGHRCCGRIWPIATRLFAGAQRCGRIWSVATGCLRALSVAGGPFRSRPDVCGRSALRADLADRDRMFACARVRSCWARPLDESVYCAAGFRCGRIWTSWCRAGRSPAELGDRGRSPRRAGRSRPPPSLCRAVAASF